MGRSLKGQWIRKAEFQHGGWLHYHIILLGLDFIPHAALKMCWPHGHIFVKRINTKVAGYMAKYQAKAGGYPDFLYDKPVRSVKIWGTSPGFWSPIEDFERKVSNIKRPREKDSLDELMDAYDLIPERGTNREAIDEASKWTHVSDDNGNVAKLRVDSGTLITLLHSSGCEVVGNAYGAVLVDATLQDAIVAKYHTTGAYTQSQRPEDSGEVGSAHAESGREAAGLHLIGLQDRISSGEDMPETVMPKCPIPRDDWPDEAAPF
ncbi:MAG: hypothetical protein AAGA25_06795 [Planctomycetota bacterium]